MVYASTRRKAALRKLDAQKWDDMKTLVSRLADFSVHDTSIVWNPHNVKFVKGYVLHLQRFLSGRRYAQQVKLAQHMASLDILDADSVPSLLPPFSVLYKYDALPRLSTEWRLGAFHSSIFMHQKLVDTFGIQFRSLKEGVSIARRFLTAKEISWIQRLVVDSAAARRQFVVRPQKRKSDAIVNPD